MSSVFWVPRIGDNVRIKCDSGCSFQLHQKNDDGSYELIFPLVYVDARNMVGIIVEVHLEPNVVSILTPVGIVTEYITHIEFLDEVQDEG